MTISVRALEEEDIHETIQIMKEAWNYAYDTWEKGYYPQEAHDFDMSLNTPERYTATMEYEHGFFFIAELDGKIIGSIRGEIVGASGFGMIRNIAVHPDYQGKGGGRALMIHTIEFLKGQGCHKVSLNTQAYLIPAVNLYLKTGFIPEAYMAKQWWGVDFIYMSIWLGSAASGYTQKQKGIGSRV